MKIKEVNSQVDFLNAEEEEFVKTNSDAAIIATLSGTEVIYNENSPCNTEYCAEHNIKCYKGKINSMGTGVVTSGSIFLTVKKKMLDGGECLSDRLSKSLCEYLKRKGINSVRCDNNDVMADDCKVASGGEIMLNGFHYMGYQISINQDIEAIREICLKPMLKKPKALSDYGITTEEIVDFCKGFFENE